MASFIVETFIPQSSADRFEREVRNIRVAAAGTRGAPHPVRHVRSYLVPDDAMAFHLVDADTVADVTRVAAAASVDVERIVTAVGVDQGPAEGPLPDGIG